MEKRKKKKAIRISIRFLRQRKKFFAIVFFFTVILFWKSLPSELFHSPYSTVTMDRNGELIGASIASDGQWRFPPTDLIPEKFVKSITTFEDRHFFRHFGVNPFSVVRAMKTNIRSKKNVSGASTLTMQVIRLSRNKHSRTVWEKLVEMVLAIRLELSKSKREILALYASHAPFGGNVVGLESASWRYFGRRPDQLTWAEAATLAVLPNSPALIHPGKGREILLAKRNLLLEKLQQNGVLDAMTCSLAKKEPLPPKPHPIPMIAPHLHDRIRIETSARIAKAEMSEIARGRTRIHTTIDKSIQIRAAEIVKRHHLRLAANGIHNAAALVLDVESKNVVAYVGNISDFSAAEHGNHVDIITARRSTGSILKPLLYAALLDSGELLPDELIPDIPIRIGDFVPQNFAKTYQGAVPASMALARSMNIPAVRMLYSFGVDRFYVLLKKLGMTTLHRPAKGYGLTLILGGAEGTLWDMTGIYAGLAQCLNRYPERQTRERYCFLPPNFLSTVSDSNTQKVSRGKTKISFSKEDPISPAASWLTVQAMLEVARPDEESAWQNFSSSQKIAWKTGTSFGFRDGWALGITPQYAVGVWVGNADGEGRPGLTGISTAAPILFELFGILNNQDWFDMPETELVEIDVCAKSGHRAGPNCAATRNTLIPRKGLRTSSCPYCEIVHCDTSLSWRVHSQCERIGQIRAVNWFVLPPAMEWFYKKRHSDYRPLPPFRNDCTESLARNELSSLSLIYPRRNGLIYIPIELDGQRGKTVFTAAHRNSKSTIYWHLDEEFLGATTEIHQMALAPKPGLHRLTLVDEHGERLEQIFRVLSKEKAH